MKTSNPLKSRVENNFRNVKLWFMFPAVFILGVIFILIISAEGNYKEAYVHIQQDLFFYLNKKLSLFPNLALNITQMGDVLVVFPFVMFLFFYAPKYWDALLTSSLLSLVVSAGLKKLFSIPRPARMFDIDSFTIVGRTLRGENSLPSGHSMTIFIVVVLLLFAFMPQKNKVYQIIWTIWGLLVGLLIASSRIGVGAHYPLDVIAGASIGYILAVIGIWIANSRGLIGGG